MIKIYKSIIKNKSKSNFFATICGVNLFKNNDVSNNIFALISPIDALIPVSGKNSILINPMTSSETCVYKNVKEYFYFINKECLYEEMTSSENKIVKNCGIVFAHFHYVKSNAVDRHKLLNINLPDLYKNNQDKIVSLKKFVGYKLEDIENKYINNIIKNTFIKEFKRINMWDLDMFFLKKLLRLIKVL